MNTKNLLIAAALVGIGLGAAATAHAQTATSGSISGVVTDQSNGQGMAGVTVVATSAALQGTQSAITEADGTYKITNLPPGSYVVTFYYAEVTVKRTDISVTINKTTPVYVKLDTSKAGGEVIEIKGAPNIDTTSTTQGVTLDRNYTKNIPVPGRTFESALGAAAGTANDGLGVSFSGSSSLENQYVVDGVNTTGLTYGTIGSPILNDFIQEIEVITGGYKAEYGRATGGVVNVVTKSGSNEFHGEVFSYFTSDILAKDPTRNPTQATPIDAKSHLGYDTNFGFDLGGPIIKDKLWFFVGFSPRLVSVKTDRITKRMTDCRTTLPDGSMSECDPMYADGNPDIDANGFYIFEDIKGGRSELNSQATQYQFVSKLNYAASPEHQGQITFSGTPATSQQIGVYGEQPATSFDVSDITTDAAAKWTSKFNNNKTELEATVGWHRDHFKVESVDPEANGLPRQNLYYGNLAVWGQRGYESEATVRACTDSGDPSVDPYPSIENCPDIGVGYRIGGPGGLADDFENRYTARLSGLQRVKAVGTHEIKGGLDLEQNLLEKPRIFSGDAYYNVYIGNSFSGGAFDRTDEFRWVSVAPPGSTDPKYSEDCGDGTSPQPCAFLGPTQVHGNTFNWAGYLQDSWQILPNLTFNAGMRYEEQRLRYAKDLQQTPDPFTGERRGKNALVLQNLWAPRVGLLYDWTKEGRSKVYASWGRFYESIPMDINERSFGGETELRRQFQQSSCGNVDPTIGAPSGPACDSAQMPRYGNNLFGGAGVLVEPGIKPQYLDEVIVGAEYEPIEDLKVGISFQNRRLGRVIEDVSVDNAATYILANPGEFSQDQQNALEGEIADLMAAGDTAAATRKQTDLDQYVKVRNFDKPSRNYNAIQLTATKRFSRNFFLQGSYTYSRLTGNYPGLFSSSNGQVDPNISSQYDLIELLANHEGPLPADHPHYFKIDGWYTFDFDRAGKLTTGGRFRALSGSPIGAVAPHYLYGLNESFVLPRGAMGRTDFDWGIDGELQYSRDIGHGMTLSVFTQLFNIPSLFKTEGVFSVDEAYSYVDNVNPVVGGEYRDLVWIKAQDATGVETNQPVRRNKNFLNPAARYNTFFAQLGARLEF